MYYVFIMLYHKVKKLTDALQVSHTLSENKSKYFNIFYCKKIINPWETLFQLPIYLIYFSATDETKSIKIFQWFLKLE